MADYLLHLRKDGYPVGIHAETASFYFPAQKGLETYGNVVVGSRGTETTWGDWCEQLEDQGLGRQALWLRITDPNPSLPDVLQDQQSGSDYAID